MATLIKYQTGELMGNNFIFLEDKGIRVTSNQTVRIALFRCHCGKEFITVIACIKNNQTKSCGCIRVNRFKTHGMYHTKIYKVWGTMIQRCLNFKNKAYDDYGGRGIIVYKPWVKNFMVFYDYVSKLPHYGEQGYSLDRIENDGNYEPGNLRWATRVQQANNRRAMAWGVNKVI